MFFEFPTKEEWRDLQGCYAFEKLNVSEHDFEYTAYPQGSLERFSAIPEIITWTVHLQNRLIQTRWSYVFLMFHFNKGIPDAEWVISPGKEGQSVEYFPHFEKKHHLIKAQFDYYADIFYYKLFSAWDTVGHLLNVTYELGIEGPTFHRAIKKLSKVKPALHDKLKAIADSPDFQKMREFRHNVTHNQLPGHVGSTVRRVSQNEVTFGVGIYTPSAQIKDNVTKSLDLFAETLEVIRKQGCLVVPRNQGIGIQEHWKVYLMRYADASLMRAAGG